MTFQAALPGMEWATPMSKLRPFLTYYGSKWRDAPTYPAPEHRTIVEPFAGAAGYSIRYADRDVILCDIDEKICGVWDYLIRAQPSEILALPDVLAGGSVDDLRVPDEAKWLIGWWLNGGSAQPCKTPGRWMRTAGSDCSWFWGEKIRRRLSSQVESIRHWQIHHCSYETATQFVTGPAAWFVDPPYMDAGVYYKHGSRDIDYSDLSVWCQSLDGQVIVCENEGADWLPFRSHAQAKTARAGRVSREVIWTSS